MKRVNLKLDTVEDQTFRGLDLAFSKKAREEGWGDYEINMTLMSLKMKSFNQFKHQLKYFTVDTHFFGATIT